VRRPGAQQQHPQRELAAAGVTGEVEAPGVEAPAQADLVEHSEQREVVADAGVLDVLVAVEIVRAVDPDREQRGHDDEVALFAERCPGVAVELGAAVAAVHDDEELGVFEFGAAAGDVQAVGEAGIALVGEPRRVPGEQGASGVPGRKLRECDHEPLSGWISIGSRGTSKARWGWGRLAAGRWGWGRAASARGRGNGSRSGEGAPGTVCSGQAARVAMRAARPSRMRSTPNSSALLRPAGGGDSENAARTCG